MAIARSSAPIIPAAPARTLFRFLTLAALLCLTACGGKGQMPDRGPAEVGVVTLAMQPVTLTTELTGRTTATKVAEVRPQVDGIIMKRLFTEASLVRAEQPLYQIDDRLYRASRDQAAAQVANAQASLATADAKLSRYRQLTQADAVSRQDLDDAQAAQRQYRASVQQYQATLASANVNLGFTRVYAPISGRIGRSAFTQGALVTATQTTALATIQQLDPIFVDIQQSSADLIALRRQLASGKGVASSATVSLKLEDGSDYPVKGKLEFAEAMVDPQTGTVTLRARFANGDGLLLPGMFVRASLSQLTARDAILVPQAGVSRNPKGEATVLVVSADNKAELRSVVADRTVGDKWLATSGLKPGDKVIVEGLGRIRPGQPIRPVPAGSPPQKPAGNGQAKGG